MILDLLFPNRCLHCNRIITGKEIICELCIEHVNFTHWDFNEDNPLKQKCNLLFPVQSAYALMQFEKESLSRKIVHDLKYRSREKIGQNLADWVSERLHFEMGKPDLLVPVPLHKKKLKERGYNQLKLFTETLSQHYGIPYDHDAIKRNFYKKAQALKDKAHRSETKNLFSINKKIENRHVLIIDDVYTTGNTISSVAWEILNCGDNTVSVLVIAVD